MKNRMMRQNGVRMGCQEMNQFDSRGNVGQINSTCDNGYSVLRCPSDAGCCPCQLQVNTYNCGPKDNFIYFLAQIEVSEGFVLVGEDYNTYLSISTLDLDAIPMTQTYQCGNTACTTEKSCILLNGNLTYNVTIEPFRAMCPLEATGLTPTTLFSTTDDIYVDKVLTCSVNANVNLTPQYLLRPERCEEFITTINGESIYRYRDCDQFYAALRNPHITKIINIPYRLSIQI